MESHRFRPEFYRGPGRPDGPRPQAFGYDREGYAVCRSPAREEWPGVEAAFRLSLFVEDIDVLLGGLKNNLAVTALIILAVSLLAAFLFSRRMSRPVQEIIRASRRVAAETSQSVSGRGPTANGRTWPAASISMTERIQTLFIGLSQKKEELDKIMSGMEEGLLVLDRSGRIVLSNAGANSLIGQAKVEGRFYWEVVRATPFVELVRKVAEEQRSSLAEVAFGEKNILCRASYSCPRAASS